MSFLYLSLRRDIYKSKKKMFNVTFNFDISTFISICLIFQFGILALIKDTQILIIRLKDFSSGLKKCLFEF